MDKIFSSMYDLFFPKVCVGCNRVLVKQEEVICTFCVHDLPIISIEDSFNNEITTVFKGLIPINEALSFLYYSKEGISQKLIHEIKYKNNPKIGGFLGAWFANLIKEKGFLSTVDYIIPVPLHPEKIKQRGYNQNTLFGYALSKVLNIPYQPDILQRISLASTQTEKNRFERFSNIKTQFLLTNVSIFKGKHVLLIDDVITTGATLEACSNQLLKTQDIKISIATLAYTSKN